MKALIIAAGDGGRFRPLTNDTPKALIPVLGLSLLERIILTSKKAGIKDFVVILGYKGEMIKDKFASGGKYGVKISYAENPAWRKENGLSVLAAENLLEQDENFVLLMGDHLFDYRILKTLISQKLGKDECILCIDRGLDNVVDFNDVTKVKVEDGYVKAIGKELGKQDQYQKDFNAFDTGIFLCSVCIFDALKKVDKNYRLNLTEGIRILAEQGKMRTLDVSGNFWLDLDTASDLSVAEKRLLKSLTKSTDGLISRHINRKISTILSRLLVKTRIKPNTLSLINFFTAII
ncbi:MAG: sugar phosphate nucleotidyltransferase, partial [Candidatus Zixiibacteriota bacterium]